MAELKFTKFELRHQQIRLVQLERYLPTLQLRKALLQAEVIAAKAAHENLSADFQKLWNALSDCAPLLGLDASVDLNKCTEVSAIGKSSENIAGVDVPAIQEVSFKDVAYDLFDTPPWLDAFILNLRDCKVLAIKTANATERIRILSEELKQVYTRVNLFEKVLIPRCVKNIKTIKIFLGDLLLAAVSQAKIAKNKILARNRLEETA
jgi:V/A-type H+/Na+-transporting ATPase subunit D